MSDSFKEEERKIKIDFEGKIKVFKAENLK